MHAISENPIGYIIYFFKDLAINCKRLVRNKLNISNCLLVAIKKEGSRIHQEQSFANRHDCVKSTVETLQNTRPPQIPVCAHNIC